MPKCKSCNERFPTRVEIDGVIRHLGARRYCLECHHFGYIKPKLPDSKIRSKTQSYRSSFQNNLRKDKRETLISIFGGKCHLCNYNNSIRAMHFHHLLPKKFNLTSTHMSMKTAENLIEEACKTVLLCSNCHAEVHDGKHKELMESITKNIIDNKDDLFQIKLEMYKKYFTHYLEEK